jgi:NADH dehydrogenase FAD-containing subunit
VELVTEIACRSPTKKITLVEANEFVLASAPSDIGKHAQNIIKAKPSIRLINQEMASKKDRQEGDKSIYETDKSHTVIEADLVYNCIGVKPNSSFLDSAWLNEKQQVVVDETLKVPHTSNVFAVGDINSVEEPKMFYTAHIQAVHFTRNMRRLLNNAPCNTLLPYRGCRVNMVVSMGPSHAVGHVAGINLTGWPLETKDGSRLAAVAKYFIERITMDDFGLKLPINDLLYYTQGKRTGHLHSS